MGRFVNPDNSAFQDVLNSKVYVDKFDLQNNLVIYPMQLYNKENM